MLEWGRFLGVGDTYLAPAELEVFGVEGAYDPKSTSEPLKSQIRLYKDDWRYGVLAFVRVLKAKILKFDSSARNPDAIKHRS